MSRSLPEVFAQAMELDAPDRQTLEWYLRLCNRSGVELDVSSVRASSEEQLAALFGEMPA